MEAPCRAHGQEAGTERGGHQGCVSVERACPTLQHVHGPRTQLVVAAYATKLSCAESSDGCVSVCPTEASATCRPMSRTIPVTRALPIKNALRGSGTPSVWLSGNMLSRSSSTGTSLLSRPLGQATTCLKREGVLPPSAVMMVRLGR